VAPAHHAVATADEGAISLRLQVLRRLDMLWMHLRAIAGAGGLGVRLQSSESGERRTLMKTLLASALLLAAAPSLATAGEIYGTIKEAGTPVKEGLKVELTCGAETAATATDTHGGYRLYAKEEGKCTLTLRVGDEAPAITIHSYDDSARYALLLERKDGKYILRSE
jgi:hypothetical protein